MGQGDWKMAIANIKLLSEECFWSPAVIDYLYAIALIKDDPVEHKPKIDELLSSIESKRKRIGGKSVPDEKMCGQKAQMYNNGQTRLELGFYEMAYIFNYLKIGNKNENVARAGLDEIAKIESQLTPCDIAISYLLRAIFHAQLNELKAAEKLISDNEDVFKDNENAYLYPAAQLELGNLYRLVGDNAAVRNQMKLAKQRNHYPYEARLHYRCHGYEQLLKSNE